MPKRSIPFWISGFIHLTVLAGAALLFVKPPVFAIDNGHSSVEVSLVAAAPDPVAPQPVEPQEEVDDTPPQPDDLVVPVKPPVPPPPAPTPPKPKQKPTVAKGDGSAPKPGKDATTASSLGGAISDSKPDYLSNPPPIYPESARQAKEMGVVTLDVIINTEGRPDSVTVQSSSGYASLDASAVTAVRKWRFRPAEIGSVKISGHYQIPVRFHLDEY